MVNTPDHHAELDILFDAAKIENRIGELARQIQQSLSPDIYLMVLLKGGFMFASDLMRALNKVGLCPKIEFIQLSSYGYAKTSSGKVNVIGSIPDMEGKNILLIDDILDTGRSLEYAVHYFKNKGAASIHSCVLLDKADQRMVDIEADFVGFSCPNRFIVGYGIDYAEKYRYLPYIAAID